MMSNTLTTGDPSMVPMARGSPCIMTPTSESTREWASQLIKLGMANIEGNTMRAMVVRLAQRRASTTESTEVSGVSVIGAQQMRASLQAEDG